MIDPLATAEPALVERIASLAQSGVPVIALGALPHRAPGLRDAQSRDARVQEAVKRLNSRVLRVPGDGNLEDLLGRHVPGDVIEPLPGKTLSISIDRRRSPAGDILFLFNESWSATNSALRFTRSGGPLTLLNPRTGNRTILRENVQAGDTVTINLEAAESLVLTLAAAASPPSLLKPGAFPPDGS